MSRLLTINEAAGPELLRMHPRTVRRHVKEGRLPHVRIGGAIRIPEDALNALIAANVRGGTANVRPELSAALGNVI
jgi:excisionase family DNA binding protein